MNLVYLSFFLLIPLSLLSIMNKKEFILPVLLALESSLLMMLTLKFLVGYFFMGSHMNKMFSLFIIALAAIEASIGLSLLTLISRSFVVCGMNQLNLLKK